MMAGKDMQGPFDLRALTGLVRRQWPLIVCATAIIAGLAVLWLMAATPLYTARTLLRIDPDQVDLLNDGSRPSANPASENARMASEVSTLRSQALALAVVERADLVRSAEFGVSVGLLDRALAMMGFAESSEPDARRLARGVVDRFQKALSVRRAGATYMIEIGVTSRDPEQAMRLANLTAAAYIEMQVAARIGTAMAARDALAARLDQADAELVASEQAFESFLDTNFARIAAQYGSDDLAQLRAEFEELRTRSTQAQILAGQAERALEQRNWQAVADQLEDSVLAELAAQRTALAGELAGILDTAEAAEAIDLRDALASLEAQLAERSSAALAEKLSEVEGLSTRMAGYQNDIRAAVLSADLPPDLLTQIFAIQQQGTLARTQYQTLLSRVRDFETQAALQVADAQVVSPALIPLDPSFPVHRLVLAVALLGGLGLGTTLAFLREFYIGGFTSERQMADVLGVRVASVIPRMAQKNTTPADLLIEEQLSLFAESIRRLRASIDQTLARQDPRPTRGMTVMVTSTLPGEGKTTTALSLARTYALSGKHTLLVDCDLRKPSILQAARLDKPRYGLLDYLTDAEADQNRLGQIMSVDIKTDLHVIASVGRSNRPTDQLLMSTRFVDLLTQARDYYDVVIIDTPPMLPVVDARYLAQYSDAIALVIKWSETRQQDVRQTLSQLEDSKPVHSPVFAVLNQQAATRGQQSYQGYYRAY